MSQSTKRVFSSLRSTVGQNVYIRTQKNFAEGKEETGNGKTVFGRDNFAYLVLLLTQISEKIEKRWDMKGRLEMTSRLEYD